jgi:hypothetical protein
VNRSPNELLCGTYCFILFILFILFYLFYSRLSIVTSKQVGEPAPTRCRSLLPQWQQHRRFDRMPMGGIFIKTGSPPPPESVSTFEVPFPSSSSKQFVQRAPYYRKHGGEGIHLYPSNDTRIIRQQDWWIGTAVDVSEVMKPRRNTLRAGAERLTLACLHGVQNNLDSIPLFAYYIPHHHVRSPVVRRLGLLKTESGRDE